MIKKKYILILILILMVFHITMADDISQKVIKEIFSNKEYNRDYIRKREGFKAMLYSNDYSFIGKCVIEILEKKLTKDQISRLLSDKSGLFNTYESIIFDINPEKIKNSDDELLLLNMLDSYKFMIIEKKSYLYTGLKKLFNLIDKFDGNIPLQTKIQSEIKEIISIVGSQKSKGFYDVYSKRDTINKKFNQGSIKIIFKNFSEDKYSNPIIKIYGPGGLIREISTSEVQKIYNIGEKGEFIDFSENIIIDDLRTDCSYDIFINCQSAIFRNGPVKYLNKNEAKKNRNKIFNYQTHSIISLNSIDSNQTLVIDFNEQKPQVPAVNKIIF